MSRYDGEYAYRFLKSIAFPRTAGTPAENRAARIIAGELKKLGLKPRFEGFKIMSYESIGARLDVFTPYRKTYEANEIGLAGNTPGRGVEGDAVFIENSREESLRKAKGKIVVSYKVNLSEIYKLFRKYGVKAFVRISDANENMMHTRLHEKMVARHGKTPGVVVGYESGLEMVKKGAKRVRVFSRGKEYKGTSLNVIAEIKGTEFPEERIAVTAHYDSVEKCPGAMDNGGGSANIMGLAKYFAKNPPKRTLVFIWFGSEEPGLVGSHDYCKKHKKELSKVKMVFNMDVNGMILGVTGASVCGMPSMDAYVEALGRESGEFKEITRGHFSSDHASFCENGVPAVAVHRSGGPYFHTPKDEARHLDGKHLAITGELGIEFLTRVGNAVEIPFELGINDKDKETLRKNVEARRKAEAKKG